MISSLFRSLILLAIAVITVACYSGMKMHSEKSQRKELQILRTVINEAVGNPYLYVDSLQLAKSLDSIENNIEGRVSSVKWFRNVSSIVTQLGCGHTLIMPSQHLFTSFLATPATFPFEVQYIEGKLYATSNYKNKEKQSIKKGMEITAVDGRSIDGIVQKMYPLFSSDAFNVSMKDAYFKDFFALYYYLSTHGEESFSKTMKVTFINAKQEVETLEAVKTYPSVEKLKKRYKNNPFVKPPKLSKFGVQRIEKKKNYAYLKLHSFAHLQGRKYEAWLRKFFREVQQQQAPYLVLDLRGNLGGLPQNELLSYLIPKLNGFLTMTLPNLEKLSYRKYYKRWDKDYFQYKKLRKESIKYQLKEHQPFVFTYSTPDAYESKMFRGKVIVLVDGLSFSSSANIVSNLKDHADVIVIGKTTGGSYQQGNTGQLKFRFPKSKFFLALNPIYFSNTPAEELTVDVGIVPDIAVKEVFGNKKSNDLYLKAAEKFIATDAAKK